MNHLTRSLTFSLLCCLLLAACAPQAPVATTTPLPTDTPLPPSQTPIPLTLTPTLNAIQIRIATSAAGVLETPAPPVSEVRATYEAKLVLTATAMAFLDQTKAALTATSSAVLESLDMFSATKIDFLLSHDENFSGSVLVASDGEVLLSKGYGLADRAQEIPNIPQTRFRIGSITKQFTAMAIMILQAQGKLKVEEHICNYIKECPEAWQEVTIHQLLTHTSGINSGVEVVSHTYTQQVILDIRKLQSMGFKPGNSWYYSNYGYFLLGHIIEQVSGQTYAAFLQQNIFEPLQMHNSGYEYGESNLATGYTGENSNWVVADALGVSGAYAAGGLYSTVEDLYLWDQALYTEQLVPQELLDLMFTPHAKIPEYEDSYGYGWFIAKIGNHQIINHGGLINGFTSSIEHYPEDKVTIIVLANRDTILAWDIAGMIRKVLYGE